MNIILINKEDKTIQLPIIKAFSTHNGVLTLFDTMGFPHKYKVDDIKQIIFD